MPRARSIYHDDRQTAASTKNGSGCLSLYSLSLLGVLVIICLITALGLYAPIPAVAASQSVSTSARLLNSSSASNLSPIFSREVQYWASYIARWAEAAS